MTNAEQPQFRAPDLAELELETGARDYSPSLSSPDSHIESILRRHEASLLEIPGVTLVSHQLVEPGIEAIIIGIIDGGVLDQLPTELEGVPVRSQITGPIEAL